MSQSRFKSNRDLYLPFTAMPCQRDAVKWWWCRYKSDRHKHWWVSYSKHTHFHSQQATALYKINNKKKERKSNNHKYNYA